MRASWSWFGLLVLAACDEHGSPADASIPRDCGGVAVAPFSGCIGDPVLSADRRTVDFGSIAVSATSPVTSIQISNIGPGASGTLTAIITGPDTADFVVANGCSQLQSMGTCVVTVVFKPVSAGSKTASMVLSGSPGGTVMVALTGIATS